ncbi:hypothetical protein [Brevibacillus centrosporus]|uniref:hypothetical protein n=1 Tax=Brevibacillus centrosporus TaxID=54910 RepID=UPI002E227FA3|nr:hypothetical protein [Brevibacillus centrosporus]
MAKQRTGKISSDVPTRIPIPERLLQIQDPQQRRDALKTHWLSYGYSDRYTVDRIEDGHYIMVKRHDQNV